METQDYSELHDLFSVAEEKIKTVEQLETDGLNIPAVNELRNAGKHYYTGCAT